MRRFDARWIGHSGLRPWGKRHDLYEGRAFRPVTAGSRGIGLAIVKKMRQGRRNRLYGRPESAVLSGASRSHYGIFPVQFYHSTRKKPNQGSRNPDIRIHKNPKLIWANGWFCPLNCVGGRRSHACRHIGIQSIKAACRCTPGYRRQHTGCVR